MKAAIITGIGAVAVETVDDATLLVSTDAIVRVERASICGSDLHAYRGEWGDPTGERPGHEFIGVVEEVGPKVSRIRVGQRVLCSGAIGCGSCAQCALGYSALCVHGIHVLGISMLSAYPGGHAEYVTVPFADFSLMVIPPDLTAEQALLLTDNLPTGWMGAQCARVTEGSSVAVFGLGPVGLCAVMSARAQGAWQVFGVDPDHDRRAFAEQLGVTAFDPSGVDVAQVILDRTEGRGVHASIEAAGRSASQLAAIQATDAIGTIAVISTNSEPLHFDTTEALAPTQRLQYVTASPQHTWPQLLPLVLRGGLAGVEHIFSHRFALDDAAAAYTLFASQSDRCRKVQLDTTH